MNIGFWIGWRFYKARQGNGFINFISFASTAGIALGVAVLIIVLSAMNGFQHELEHRFLGVIPQAELIGVKQPIENWPKIITDATKIKGITGAAPFIRIEGLVQKNNGFQGLSIAGIDPKLEPHVSAIKHYMSNASWHSLNENTNNIVLGSSLLTKLGLKVGDTLSLYVPNLQAGKPHQLSAAKSHRFIISGTYQLGGELEQHQAYISMDYAQHILGLNHGVTGIRIKVDNVFSASSLIRDLGYRQNQYLYINDWTRTQGHLYSDIQLVRTIMYMVLALVIAVACFNIVSTLVMAVRDKSSEIAILMTMGVRRSAIMIIFIIQGVLNGTMGCLFGGVFGYLIADNLTLLTQAIEKLLHIKLLAADIYFIDFIPSQIHSTDIILVISLAFIMSLIATIYPAYKASCTLPVRALSGR